MDDKRKVMDIDEALISFAYDLFEDNLVSAVKLLKHLDNRGVTKIEIIHCTELKDDQKILFLKEIEEL